MKIEFRRNSFFLWLLGIHIDEELAAKSSDAALEVSPGGLLALIRMRLVCLWHPDRNPIEELVRQMGPGAKITERKVSWIEPA